MNKNKPRLHALLNSSVFRLALIAVGPLILVGRFLIQGKVLFWGTPSLQFVPWWLEGLRQMQDGVVPLWNAFNGMGAPLLANYQTAFFYPPNWILFLFYFIWKTEGLAWGFTFLAMLHLVWGGWGMLFFLRQRGASPFAQVIGGMAYALGGYLVGRLEFFSMIWVASWLPWIVGYCERFFSTEEIKAGVFPMLVRWLPGLAVLFSFQWLAGHAQLSWYTLVFTGIWGIVRSFSTARWHGLIRWLVLLACAGVLAGMISAVQLLPTAEYLLHSQRASEYGFEEAVVYSYWPWRLLTLLAPDLFGNPGTGNYWGYATYWEDAAYLGLIPLGMAFTTLRGVFGRRYAHPWLTRRQTLGLWLGVAVFFILAMGKNTPVFPFLYHHVPSFNLFQAPARWMILVVFLLIILASAGIDSWHHPSGRGLYWLRLGTAGAFAITLGAGLASLVFQNIRSTFILSTAVMGWWALLAGGLTLIIPWFEKKDGLLFWQYLVVLAVGADLLLAGWNLNPVVSTAFYSETTSSERLLQQKAFSGRVFLSDAEEYFLKFRRFFRFQDYRAVEPWHHLRSVLLPNTNLYNRISSAVNFDPFVPRRFADWMDALNQRSEEEISLVLPWMGVSVWEKLDGSSPIGVRFDPVSKPIEVAWFACAQRGVEDVHQVMDYLVERKAVKGPLLLEAIPGESCADEDMLLLDAQLRSSQIVVVSPEEGWLYFAQIVFPGWQAYVDEQPVPIYRANYAFMAVYSPRQGASIRLIYNPLSFRIGALLSILGLILLGIFTLRAFDRFNRVKKDKDAWKKSA